jgi:hypothetical protein
VLQSARRNFVDKRAGGEYLACASRRFPASERACCSPDTGKPHPVRQVVTAMKKLRILIYTDSLGLEDEDDSICISDLRRFIPLKLKGVVDVKTCVRVRHYDYQLQIPRHAATKLTHDLLAQFDELWVIGFENLNQPGFRLTPKEIGELGAWMTSGGVMVTGDHSQFSDDDDVNNEACRTKSHDKFRSLGYSLGSLIPRARQMRVWKGAPTNCTALVVPLPKSDTHNTQTPGSGNLDDLSLQSDDRPQILEPTLSPHFLFTYRYDASHQPIPITQFPDHAHEGNVIVPASLDGEWPGGSPPPQIVARGSDKRFPPGERVYALVAAYDGDASGVGRIVADSSFHHFLNTNLGGPPALGVGLPERDALGNPVPNTPLDELAQFYANLAYWLAPRKLREEIKRELLFRAARHLNVLETLGNGTARLGAVAKDALVLLLGASNLTRVLEAVGGEGEDERSWGRLLDYVIAGRGGDEALRGIAHEHLLGSVIESYYEFFRAQGVRPLMLTDDIVPPEVTLNAVADALRTQSSLAQEVADRLSAELSSLSGKRRPGRRETRR